MTASLDRVPHADRIEMAIRSWDGHRCPNHGECPACRVVSQLRGAPSDPTREGLHLAMRLMTAARAGRRDDINDALNHMPPDILRATINALISSPTIRRRLAS